MIAALPNAPDARTRDAQTGPVTAGLAEVCPDVAAVQRACYGRRLAPLDCGDGVEVQVGFEATRARQVEMQWRVRVTGLDFELQFVDAASLFDLGSALSPGVPLGLQRAAVLHAASALLEALEQRLGVRIELTGLAGEAPAWEADALLCLSVSRTGVSRTGALGTGVSGTGAQKTGRPAPGGTPADVPSACAVFLRALQPEGWRVIRHAASSMLTLPPAHDALIDASLVCDPVVVSVAELRQIEAGDVLLLDAPATALDRVPVVVKLGSHRVPVVQAWLGGGRAHITRVAPTRIGTPPAGADRHRPWSKPMEPPERADADDGAAANADPSDRHPFDDLQVEIEIELGRLALPLSALRSLAVGQVFETDRPAGGEGLVLWCGGRQLGMGRLVTVGDRLGVRVMALGGPVRDETDASPRATPTPTPAP